MDRVSNAASSADRRQSPVRLRSVGIWLLGLGLFSPMAQAGDTDILLTLRDSTGGTSSPLFDVGWGTGSPCNDHWTGVICTPGGTVESLNLEGLGLQGTLPSELGGLSDLVSLRLSGNQFSGVLPDSLGNLAQLKTLRLDGNAFEGKVPRSLSSLAALVQLDLRYNRLEPNDDEEVNLFLNGLQIEDHNWSQTQTVVPADIHTTARTIDSVTLQWDPIAYQAGGGHYEVVVSTDTSFTDEDTVVPTTDKSISTVKISGLEASRLYYFAVRTVTENPGGAHQSLVSRLSDTLVEYTLLDTDGDGIPDETDPDADNDGLLTEKETADADTDGDGLPDAVEPNNIDTDGDGLSNDQDADDDGDGVSTLDELGDRVDNPRDSDLDGLPDYLDIDSNNAAATSDGSGDSDQDGFSDSTECPRAPVCVDTDGDGFPDYIDKDDDNDGRLTVEEGTTADSDGDGIVNALEANNIDSDRDGVRNHLDTDDDGDGQLTRDERGDDALYPLDLDQDHIPDYLDPDSRNLANTADGSGDSDNDGLTDKQECPSAPSCPDANGDGTPSYLDEREITIVRVAEGVLGEGGEKSSSGDAVVKTGGGGGSLGFAVMFLLSLLTRRRFNKTGHFPGR
ncbi:MAG TPA: hypothetical protein ENJ84_09085 [Gammaproteobacteria bacterium]|nr:hypothetical protein [Gammaproteobacteria bacterium]